MKSPLALLRSHPRRVILLLLGGMLMVWWLRTPPIDVESGVVDEGPLRVTLDESGVTRARPHAVVYAPVTGFWIPDPHADGDMVSPGERLGIMRAAPLDATTRTQLQARVVITETSVREVAARRDAITSSVHEAQRAYDRLVRIAAAGGASPQQVEEAQFALVQARQQLIGLEEQLRAAVADRQAARAMLDDRQAPVGVTVPIGGRLLRRLEQHDRVVPAGTPLAELGATEDLEIVVPVLTSEVGRIRDRATATVSFGPAPNLDGRNTESTAFSDTLHGYVLRIEPAAYTRLSALGVEEQRVNVVVRIPRFTGGQRMVGDQFRAETRITLVDMPKVVRVPVGALVRDDSTWFVWRIEEGRVLRRRIVPGARNATHAAVVTGLAAGDRVVLYPGEQVDDKVRVRIRGAAAKDSP